MNEKINAPCWVKDENGKMGFVAHVATGDTQAFVTYPDGGVNWMRISTLTQVSYTLPVPKPMEEDKIGDEFKRDGETYRLIQHDDWFALLNLGTGETWNGFHRTIWETFGTNRNLFIKVQE